jgi:hypothetical protein
MKEAAPEARPSFATVQWPQSSSSASTTLCSASLSVTVAPSTMWSTTLDRAREAASLLVRRLGDTGVVSVVAYDEDVRTHPGSPAAGGAEPDRDDRAGGHD